MLTRPAQQQAWQIVLLTCRDPATDFRLPLAQALHALGHRVHYIHLKRRPAITDLSDAGSTREFSAIAFLRCARATFRSSAPLAFFNSTNLRFPLFSRALRLLCGGLWCFDMHDDLLYESTGLERAKARLAQNLLLSGSDITLHAAPALQRLFPASHHLGNASSIPRLKRQAAHRTRVLILASIDRRLDFDFLAATARAAPGITFDIHGEIADERVTSRLEEAIAANANIRHHGSYKNEDLPAILSSYAIMFAPYALSPLTAYIDPLRFYHAINSGMELVSTPIPRALDLDHVIHIVLDPSAAANRLLGLADNTAGRRNADPNIRLPDWHDRAQALIEILALHHKKTHA